MRKFLLGSTALVSAAALVTPVSASVGEKIQLELRGYAQFGLAGIVSEPDNIPDDPLTAVDESEFADGNSVVFGSDSEVHFRGKTTLDSGLTISFRAELELEDDPEVDDLADIIDEVYVQFDGGFGRLQFGLQDGAADQMIISAPNVFAQFTISTMDMNPFELYTADDIDSPARDLLGTSGSMRPLDTSPDFTQDFTKVIYFTPRIYGVQLGVSYAPNPCRHDRGLDLNTSADGDSDPDFSASCGADRVVGSNFWEVAGNFEQEFDSFGVGLSASYGQGDANPFIFALSEGPSEWHVGGELFFGMGSGRLTVGGAYKETDNQAGDNTPGILNDSRNYDVGAKYAFGPWEIGGAYGKVDGTDSEFVFLDEQELKAIIGGVSYKLGPGIKLGVGVVHSDAKVSSFVEGVFGSDDKADSTAVFSELDLRF